MALSYRISQWRKSQLSIVAFIFPNVPTAYYDYINDAPDDATTATIMKEAMEKIEDENSTMFGVLPKEVYA